MPTGALIQKADQPAFNDVKAGYMVCCWLVFIGIRIITYPDRGKHQQLLKTDWECFEDLSMNGKTLIDLKSFPFVLSPVEGLREGFSATCYIQLDRLLLSRCVDRDTLSCLSFPQHKLRRRKP